ncbi:MAG TPA: CrcB family protein [Acidimicrobiales bacterium]|nr:CrcB family protein [Acidimicrobiales bacterium]
MLAVMAAGGAGALARTFVNDAIAHRVRADFPFGILTVNVTGSFALGLLTGLTWYHGLSSEAFTIAAVGVCGGFTTWSTAIWETLALLRLRLFTQAALYTLGGLALALGVAAAGIGVAALA